MENQVLDAPAGNETPLQIIPETPKRKKPNKKILLIAAVIVISVACLGAAFGKPLAKRFMPVAFIGSAASKTFGSVPLANEALAVQTLLEGNVSASLSLEIEDFQGASLGLDESLLEMLQTGRLSLSAARDARAREAAVSANFRSGLRNILHADMFVTDTQFAFKIPQALDRYLYADPNKFASQWNGTFLGAVAPIDGLLDRDIGDIYKAVTDILFYTPPRETPDRLARELDAKKLLSGAKYAYKGTAPDADMYEITLKRDAVNGFLGDLFGIIAPDTSPLAFDGDLPVRLTVSGGMITKISLSAGVALPQNLYISFIQTAEISATVEFTGTGQARKTDAVSAALSVKTQGSETDLSLYWDTASRGGNNFSLDFGRAAAGSPTFRDETSLSVRGLLRIGEDGITANMSRVEFVNSTSASSTAAATEDNRTRLGLSAECSVTPLTVVDTDYNRASSKALIDFDLFDAIELLRNLYANEFFAQLIGGEDGDFWGLSLEFIANLLGNEYFSEIIDELLGKFDVNELVGSLLRSGALDDVINGLVSGVNIDPVEMMKNLPPEVLAGIINGIVKDLKIDPVEIMKNLPMNELIGGIVGEFVGDTGVLDLIKDLPIDGLLNDVIGEIIKDIGGEVIGNLTGSDIIGGIVDDIVGGLTGGDLAGGLEDLIGGLIGSGLLDDVAGGLTDDLGGLLDNLPGSGLLDGLLRGLR